jgi:hypothetical protein
MITFGQGAQCAQCVPKAFPKSWRLVSEGLGGEPMSNIVKGPQSSVSTSINVDTTELLRFN